MSCFLRDPFLPTYDFNDIPTDEERRTEQTEEIPQHCWADAYLRAPISTREERRAERTEAIRQSWGDYLDAQQAKKLLSFPLPIDIGMSKLATLRELYQKQLQDAFAVSFDATLEPV